MADVSDETIDTLMAVNATCQEKPSPRNDTQLREKNPSDT
ncbi:hypothetical protein RCH23_001547 [Cryobacterium sp. CAN_C3]|nr:hypothetical protein [Cryobacterium sp. CAN_C3]